MAAVKELLRAEADGALGFGDYTLSSKTKLDGFEFQGDVYKVKTFSEITKLEKNGMFVYESVPGTAVEDFKASEREVSFKVLSFYPQHCRGEVRSGRVLRQKICTFLYNNDTYLTILSLV